MIKKKINVNFVI